MIEWQPISTCPKKDEPILAYHPVMGITKTYGNKDLPMIYTHWMFLPPIPENNHGEKK